MSVKFHISKDGTARQCRAQSPATCRATKSEHEEHYETREEAQKAYEEQDSNVSFATLEKEWKKLEQEEVVERQKEKSKKHDKELNDANSKMLNLKARVVESSRKIITSMGKKDSLFLSMYEVELRSALSNMDIESTKMNKQFSKEDSAFLKNVYAEASIIANFSIHDYYYAVRSNLLSNGPLTPPKDSALKSMKTAQREYKEYEEKIRELKRSKSKIEESEQEIKQNFDSVNFKSNTEYTNFQSKIRDQFPDTYDYLLNKGLIKDNLKDTEELAREKNYINIKTAHRNKKHNDYINRLNREFEKDYNKIPSYGYDEDYDADFTKNVNHAKTTLYSMEDELSGLRYFLSEDNAVYSKVIYNEASILLHSKIYEYYDEKLADLEEIAIIDPSYTEPKKPFFKTKKYEQEYKEYKKNMKKFKEAESNKLEAEEEIKYIINEMKEDKFIHKNDIEEIFQSIDKKEPFNYFYDRYVEKYI